MMILMGELLAKSKKKGMELQHRMYLIEKLLRHVFSSEKLRAPIILDVAAVHGIL